MERNNKMQETGTELAHTGEQQGGGNQLAAMFQGLMEAVKDPAVDAEKAAAMLALQERLIDRQAEMDFHQDRTKAMMEMPTISKDGAIKNKAGNVQSRYARFEDIDRVVRPICNRHGLVYSFNIGAGERGAVLVSCELAHVGGHMRIYGPLAVPADTSGAKNATQGAGSAVSYGKRYTLCAALNIVTENADDDGQSATPQIQGDTLDWTDEVLSDAQAAATRGTEAYARFFQGLSPMRKGWLVESGHHENCKTAAAAHG